MSQPFGDLVECLLNLVAQRMKQQMESMPGLPAGTEIRTAFAWILSFLAASISSAGGVGGGSLFLPILNLVLGLELKTAATFSAFMVTGGSLSNVIFNIFSRNSNSSRTKSLIDYEIALLSQPCLLLGVSVGVLFNLMFPEWLITVLLASFLVFSTFKTCSAGLKRWKNESEEARRERASGDAEESGGEIEFATVGTPWGKVVILIIVWLSFFGVQVLLGGKNGQSFIHIRPCGVGYWLITASQIPLAIGIETLPKVIFPIAALLSGILGGIFGIGGGLLINPVLLQIGVPPQTTAATTCFMVLFSSLMSSVQYLILGMKGVIVALVYAMLCFVGSILGLSIIQRIVLKSGRVSLIVFMVSIVMALSTVSITCFGAIDVWRAYNAGKSMGFKLPC
ncbi:hypothetical protein J5N97_011560 [Dioscorea zingiberensis]|uniref:Sulfite exporter TauE/SafE family protein n=1 Tax=Dioscorea zingiberensis TaxID=325984 RepID=A0A9D5D3A9_9LILI|nr:hypothetical protein J5N97_011560 [Dioscorea zingiberensis]